MIGEAAYCDGKAYIIFKSPDFLERFKRDVEGRAISLVVEHEYRDAEEVIDFLIQLEDSYEKMVQDSNEDTSTGFAEDQYELKEREEEEDEQHCSSEGWV